MTHKQYADMAMIMQFSRIFSEQMYKCLANSGLLKQGYSLKIEVCRESYGFGDEVLTSCIELEKDICTADDWDETHMCQMKMSGKEWMVHADPLAEEGTVPPEVHFRKDRECGSAESRPQDAGKDSDKPYPPFDMWVGSADDPADVGGGM